MSRQNIFPMKTLLTSVSFILLAGLIGGAEADRSAPTPPSVVRGEVYQSASGTKLRILTDRAMFGGDELEIAEITFVPNSDSGEHVHGATETFYVLEGELEHFVNGKSVTLTAGMIGTVRPPDKVRHKTGPAGAKAVVVWVPGQEGRLVASRWTKEP